MSPKYPSMQSIANEFKITKQAISFRIKYLGLTETWKKYKKKEKKERKPISALFCIYFVQHPEKRFYSFTKDFHNHRQRILSLLRHEQRLQNELQKDFKKYGEKSIQIKIIEESTDISYLKHKKREAIKSQHQCYNLRIPFRKPDEFYRDMMAQPSQKSKYQYITWIRVSKSWKAQPMKNGRQVYLGYFKKEIEAKKAIDKFLNKRTLQIFNE
jgi:hypothetical protein